MLKIKPCSFVIDWIDALTEREVFEFLDSLRDLFPPTQGKKASHKLIMFCRQSLGRGVQLESIPSSAHFEIRLKNIQCDLLAFVDHEVDFRQRRCSITKDMELIEETKRVLKTQCGKMYV